MGRRPGRPVLVVMSRWPAFGRCKRRLAASIGNSAAARVQTRLRAHALAVSEAMQREGVLNLQLAMAGGGAEREQRRLRQAVSLQGTGCLGLTMRRQLLRASRTAPGQPLLIIGTDLPSLSRRDLWAALEAVQQHPLVIGPAEDGGYWLLGLNARLARQCPAWLFTGIAWGGDQVLHTTLKRSRDRGFAPHLLETHNDIDRLEDLRPWLV